MKIALFEITKDKASLRYISSELEIKELETLQEYISTIISNKIGMMPKGKRNEL